MFRVLHISQFCHLFSSGGTEHFQQEILRLSERYDVEASLMILKDESLGIQQINANERIWSCYRDPSIDNAPYLYLDESRTVESFRKYLSINGKPDVICFHTFGQAEYAIANVAVETGIPYVLIYHTPALTCIKGNLINERCKLCSGEITPYKCGKCFLGNRYHVPVFMFPILAPILFGSSFLSSLLPKRLKQFSTLWRKLKNRKHCISELFKHASGFVAFSDAGEQVFLNNGGHVKVIHRLSQGCEVRFLNALHEVNTDDHKRSGKIKISIIGRCCKEKGIHIVLQAVIQRKELDCELHIVGVTNHDPYYEELKSIAGADSRIFFHNMMPIEELVRYYCQTDILAIPSAWYETGPITLFEGLAAGCLVMGSNMIGQLDTLKKHGIVVEPNTPSAWGGALPSVIPTVLNRRTQREQISVRNFDDVTEELNQILEDCSVQHK